MAAQNGYTLGYLPKMNTKVPFAKIWSDSDDDAKKQAGNLVALRVVGTQWSLSKGIWTNPAGVIQAGNGLSLTLEFRLANGVIIKITIQRAKPNADVNALAQAAIAHCTGPNGEALVELVRAQFNKQVYV